MIMEKEGETWIEGERERDRHTHTHTDRQTDRQTDIDVFKRAVRVCRYR